MTFGERLKELREKQKLTQQQLAEKIGVTSQVISNYERDYRGPEIKNILTLAKLFNVTTDFLLGVGEPEEPETFGKRLKKLRKENDLTSKSFGEILGLAESVISGYELDTRKPELATIIRICRLFDLSADYLLGLKEERN